MTAALSRTLAAAATIAYVAWTAAWLVEGARAPGYDWSDDAISELAATGASTASVMIPMFFVLALGTLAVALVLRGSSHPAAPLVMIAGLGALGAGPFRCDPGCPAPADGTWHNAVHVAVSAPYFLGLIAAAAVSAWKFRKDSPRYAALSLAAAVAAAVALVTLGVLDNGPGAGLAQRIAVVTLSAWTVGTGVRCCVEPSRRSVGLVSDA